MSFNKYFDTLSCHKKLSHKENEDVSIDNLVKNNLRLVVKIAHNYKDMGVDLEDLVQEGNIGLIKASEKYIPSKGKFGTFAAYYIKLKIRNYLSKNTSIVSETHLHKSLSLQIKKFKLSFGDNEPTISEIAKGLNITEKRVRSTLKHTIKSTISFDANIKKDSQNKNESILHIEVNNMPYDNLVEKDTEEHIKYLMSQLDDKESFIIIERFFNKTTFKNLGNYLGISSTHAQNLENNVLKKLKSLSRGFIFN